MDGHQSGGPRHPESGGRMQNTHLALTLLSSSSRSITNTMRSAMPLACWWACPWALVEGMWSARMLIV